MRKNLLELCFSPDLGGLELYMVRSAKALTDEFEVVSVINTDSKLDQYYEDSQYQYIKIPRKRSFSFSTARKLSKIIDEHNIEIIHMHWTKDLPIAVMAKVLSKKKPKLVQTRNMTMTRFKDDFYHRFLYKHMDMILPVTFQVADQINRFIPESIRPKVEVLYMGSDKPEVLSDDELNAYKKEIGTAENEFIIGMVGRIEETKGQYLLIEAAQVLKASGMAAKIIFVGHAMEESYKKELEAMVKDKGLENEISFLGFTKNPHRFMQACDVMVLATKCETFGLVVIEAMQVDAVMVATNQCGPLEIIEDGKSGLLFESGDSADLAKKLGYLYGHPKERKAIAEEAKKRVKELFSNDKQFKKLAEVLNNL